MIKDLNQQLLQQLNLLNFQEDMGRSIHAALAWRNRSSTDDRRSGRVAPSFGDRKRWMLPIMHETAQFRDQFWRM